MAEELRMIDERLNRDDAEGFVPPTSRLRAAVGLPRSSAVERPALNGKTALVTGGSRGLGLAVAHELVAAGMQSVAICARGEAGLERARANLARSGARVLAIRTDVADRRQAERLVEVVVGSLGRLDVLVNGVGSMPGLADVSATTSDAGEAAGANFWALLYVTLAARPVMRRQGGGRIVNIGFLGPRAGEAMGSDGHGSALALLQFSGALRAELARDGIAMTTVFPGVRAGRGPERTHRHGEPWWHAGAFGPEGWDGARWTARQIVRACRNGDARPPAASR